jgi:hypothetical protein
VAIEDEARLSDESLRSLAVSELGEFINVATEMRARLGGVVLARRRSRR